MEDTIVLAVIGTGIMLLSILIWKAAFKEWKKAKEYKQYLTEHEGDSDKPKRYTEGERGQLMTRGLTALAIGIFIIGFVLEMIDGGAPIWFPAMWMLLVIYAGSQAVFDLTDALQFGRTEPENFGESPTGEISSGRKRRVVGLILLGVLGIYDAVSFGMAFARGISAKALPLILLGNAVIILTVIVQTGIDIKALYRRKREKSE